LVKVILKTRLKAQPSRTLGDQTQLNNAIINLAINSRDAMPNGGSLVISTKNVSREAIETAGSLFELNHQNYIEINIADTGNGMDSEVLKHIYEPFYTTKGENGTGLGLSAVYGTMQNHQGAIFAQSIPGQGANFKLYLPLEIKEQSSQSAEANAKMVRDDAPKSHAHTFAPATSGPLCSPEWGQKVF